MPKKLGFKLVRLFDDKPEYDKYIAESVGQWTNNKSHLYKCLVCIMDDHNMRITYGSCSNPNCKSAAGVIGECGHRIKTLTCQQTGQMALYEVGEHLSDVFEKKHHGLTPLVKELVDNLIFTYDNRPKRIFQLINHMNSKSINPIDVMPTLKQVQDYVKNSRHRKSVNTNGGVESSGEFASSTYSQNLNYNDNMLVNDNEYEEEEEGMDNIYDEPEEHQQQLKQEAEDVELNEDDQQDEDGGNEENNGFINIGDDDEDDENDEDEDSDGDEMVDEEAYKKQLEEYEKAIAETPLPYTQYEDIIKFTRSNGDLTKCREYRQKMSAIFPLGEHLWLEWLGDEKKYVDTTEDRKRVDELFQRAIKDYLSVDIWLEYIQFSIGGMGEENGLENVRQICEKACSFAGLHVSKGYVLWEAYREFESALLAGYQQTYAGTILSTEQTAQVNKQIERIHKIFESQLSICLDNLESTYEEFRQFDEAKANDTSIKEKYENALKMYKRVEAFETALSKCNEFDLNAKLEEYNKYLDFEIKLVRDLENANIFDEKKLNDQRLRVKCLFERAIADQTLCLSFQLWSKYVNFLNEQTGEQAKEYNLSVFERSVRNVTSSSKLWINYALALEKYNFSDAEIKKSFNDAMNVGLEKSTDYLQLWHFYLDYLRRSLLLNFDEETESRKEEIVEEIRDTFHKAINQLFEYFKLIGDPTFSLEKYWALVEAKYFKNMERARKIYNEMILNKGQLGKYSSAIWAEFFEVEREYGDEKHQRKLLHRAINELEEEEEKEIIYELTLKFEKLNGNVAQFSSFYVKYEAFKANREAVRQKLIASAVANKKPVKSKAKNDRSAQNQFHPVEEAKSAKINEKSTNLKRKTSDNNNETTNDNGFNSKDKDGFKIPSLPTIVENPQKKPKKTENPPIQQQPLTSNNSDSRKFDSMRSNLTIFISNLNYDVDEVKLKAIFEKEPGFKEIRLIRHWSGKTKGYGYVDFEKAEQATNALKLDRTPIDGRPMFVSKNKDKNDKTLDFLEKQFKYSTNLEKTKLFVSGLPFSMEKPALEDLFKNFGKLKEVRIVQFRNGKSKGLAYVEFEDEQSASKALIQTDGMLIGENQIAVAISNPPKRKQGQFDEKEVKKELSSSLGVGSVTSRNPSQQQNAPGTSSNSTSSNSFGSLFIPRSQQLMSRKKTLNLK